MGYPSDAEEIEQIQAIRRLHDMLQNKSIGALALHQALWAVAKRFIREIDRAVTPDLPKMVRVYTPGDKNVPFKDPIFLDRSGRYRIVHPDTKGPPHLFTIPATEVRARMNASNHHEAVCSILVVLLSELERRNERIANRLARRNQLIGKLELIAGTEVNPNEPETEG